MTGSSRPVVDHNQGWSELEDRLAWAVGTNRSRDAIFDGMTLEITFELVQVTPRRGDDDAIRTFLPVKSVKIIE